MIGLIWFIAGVVAASIGWMFIVWLKYMWDLTKKPKKCRGVVYRGTNL